MNEKKGVMGAVRDSQTKIPGSGDPAENRKEEFSSPYQDHVDEGFRRSEVAKKKAQSSIERQTEEMVEKANKAMSDTSDADLEEFEKLEKISDKDLEMAEQIVFKGYAEYDVTIPNMPDHKFTLCTTSAEDMSVIDEIIFEMVKERESDDGNVDLPMQHVQTMRSALFLALGFKSVDGKDFCDEPINQLMTIKRAIIKVKDLEYEGEMDKSRHLCESLKKSVKRRANRIRRYPTPVIDFLSQKKYEFDNKMYRIMMSKEIIPKFSGQSQGQPEHTSSTQEESSNTDQ